jgi:hypothetical protein
MAEANRNGKTSGGAPYPIHERGDADEVDHGDWQPAEGKASVPTQAQVLPILTAGELVTAHPHLRPVLIDGLLRQGETANIIAPPKIGKSWLTYGLAISVATGRHWLGTYRTSPGNVLLIDNELHPETIAHRLPKVAEVMGVPFTDVADKIDVLALRGRLRDLGTLASQLAAIGRGRYVLSIVDAFYRTLPDGTDENDNAKITGLYNLVDSIADALGASFVFVHHASKGDQSGKSVTDVGSGAGSQSRAADTHIVLRPHEEPNVVVLEAAVRSFQQPPAECLRWTFPIWTPDPALDPTKLRKPNRRPKSENKPVKEPKVVWTVESFVAAFGKPQPQHRSAIVDQATVAGVTDRKVKELLKAALERDLLFEGKTPTGQILISTVRPNPPAGETPQSARVCARAVPPTPPLRKRRGRGDGARARAGTSSVAETGDGQGRE